MTPQNPKFKGRGAPVNPPNRYERTRVEDDWEQLDAADDELPAGARAVPTEFLPDKSQSLIVENHSPDVPFRFSMNPYRGCEHGCAYCYARPGHETLGMNAGLDFETKVLVKHDAVRLLRQELAKPSWRGDVIALSGVTDCYQPAERRFRLTRGLLEVMLEARQPVGIVTKNALVLRDLDILQPMAEQHLVHVNLSVTTLDSELARTMEPRTATPAARLRAIRDLSAAGVPARVIVAPIIPGLNDHEMPQILTAAKEAGARAAAYVLLRLPLAVAPIFTAWLAEYRPLAKERVEQLIRSTRGGELNDSQFGSRMRGKGPYADGIRRTFQMFTKKLDLDQPLPPLDSSRFRPPRSADGQLSLF